MLEPMFRRYVQYGCDVIARMCGYVPPIYITALSLITGFLCAGAIASTYVTLAAWLLWISALFDVLDGTFARVYHTASRAGMYADLISDRLVEASVAIGLAYAYPELGVLTTLFISGVLFHFATFMLASLVIPNTGEKSVHYEWSIIERAEAFVVITGILIYPSYRVTLLSLLSVIIIADAIARFIRVYRHA